MKIDVLINNNIKMKIKYIESVLNIYGDLKIEDFIKIILNRFFKRNIYVDSVKVHIDGEYNTYDLSLHIQNNYLKNVNYEVEYEKTVYDTSIIFNCDESDITEINNGIHKDIYYKWRDLGRKGRSVIILNEGKKYII